MTTHCPLCASTNVKAYTNDKRRAYFNCATCQLVFAEPSSWPTNQQEKAEYDLHENELDDAGYNRFLARITQPLHQRLPAASQLLDFGCGPAPALAQQLESLGHRVALYDVFYHHQPEVLQQRFQGIVMTEVIEHLHQPLPIIEQLWQQLSAGGVLAIMTQRVINLEKFQNWTYKNDPTHVCFYHENTFAWLAQQLHANLAFEGRDMVFLSKELS